MMRTLFLLFTGIFALFFFSCGEVGDSDSDESSAVAVNPVNSSSSGPSGSSSSGPEGSSGSGSSSSSVILDLDIACDPKDYANSKTEFCCFGKVHKKADGFFCFDEQLYPNCEKTGDPPYNPNDHICFEKKLYPKCESENIITGICVDNTLKRCRQLGKGSMYIQDPLPGMECLPNGAIVGEINDFYGGTFTGQVYRAAQIGSQVWLAEDLRREPSTGRSQCFDVSVANGIPTGVNGITEGIAFDLIGKEFNIKVKNLLLDNFLTPVGSDGLIASAADITTERGYVVGVSGGIPVSVDGKTADVVFDLARVIYIMKINDILIKDYGLIVDVNTEGKIVDAGAVFNGTINDEECASTCYGNNPANCGKSSTCPANDNNCLVTKYGRMYKWPDAMTTDDPKQDVLIQGLCPDGYYTPSLTSWKTLIEYAGGRAIAGGRLKSATTDWGDGKGTDSYGFSALPGGYRAYFLNSAFDNPPSWGNLTMWWTATHEGKDKANANYVSVISPDTESRDDYKQSKNIFMSHVRCVRSY